MVQTFLGYNELRDQIKGLDERLDNLENNRLRHIEIKIGKLEVKVAAYAALFSLLGGILGVLIGKVL